MGTLGGVCQVRWVRCRGACGYAWGRVLGTMGTPVGCVQVRLGACVRYDGYACGVRAGTLGGVC